MSSYFSAVSAQLKDWKKAILVVVFTVARIIYGYEWIVAGWEKATTWFSDGKLDSYGLINTMVNNLNGPKVTRFDPLYINKAWAWVAHTFFMGWAPVTDVLVVVCEIGVGLFFVLGIRVFWAALVGLFMNTQFITAGSFNNFGYIWTNIIAMNFGKYFDLIGVSGFFRYKRNKDLL